MHGAWGGDDPGISRAEFRQLQKDLVRLGHKDVVADGFDGPVTREAIRTEERLRGWPETGRAGARIARLLSDEASVDSDKKATPPTDDAP